MDENQLKEVAETPKLDAAGETLSSDATENTGTEPVAENLEEVTGDALTDEEDDEEDD